jgi:hypothetical protein
MECAIKIASSGIIYLPSFVTIGSGIHVILRLLQQRFEGAVSTANGYGLNDRGVGIRDLVGSRIFSSPHRPVQLWGPLNPLSNRYKGFPGGKAARA